MVYDIKQRRYEDLIELYPENQEGVWELHSKINPTQTVIIEVISGKFKDAVEYASSLEENITLIKELKAKRVNPYSGKTLAELYKEKSELQEKLRLIERELQDGDVDYE